MWPTGAPSPACTCWVLRGAPDPAPALGGGGGGAEGAGHEKEQDTEAGLKPAVSWELRMSSRGKGLPGDPGCTQRSCRGRCGTCTGPTEAECLTLQGTCEWGVSSHAPGNWGGKCR